MPGGILFIVIVQMPLSLRASDWCFHPDHSPTTSTSSMRSARRLNVTFDLSISGDCTNGLLCLTLVCAHEAAAINKTTVAKLTLMFSCIQLLTAGSVNDLRCPHSRRYR